MPLRHISTFFSLQSRRSPSSDSSGGAVRVCCGRATSWDANVVMTRNVTVPRLNRTYSLLEFV